jgi:hypothetical protein
LNGSYFASRNIDFEWAEAADAGFPSLQGNFVVAGGNAARKCPLSSVVNDATSALLFSTTNVAFASGTEPGASALIGPGLAGLIVMIPSIPDSPPDGVCSAEAQTAMTMSPKAASKLRNVTAHYIRAASRWSTIRSTKRNLNRTRT